ncbi:helix-turn-helix transcriptional regulator [Corynebacterium sp. TA-R-1]|uniref:Helix-turn-helix transcriptional regulator n=1 Tax=Corynebacterium stercoris TaxID=2943490 RepID=A0ABT1G0N9_9CORY|nr:helix-turn-helix transcriptional regulator [Corynebacterium stercoris]MCP1387599.1 helix-turn-helix transcriptional regulator [Corynebacterium stercoris]
MADEKYYVISAAAELTGMHAQTLRQYDRLGLVTPIRTRGGGRRYSTRDITMLRRIQQLSQEEGVNLAGIKTIIELTERIETLEGQLDTQSAKVEELQRQLVSRRTGGELVHVPRSTQIVLWDDSVRRRRKTAER